MLCYLWPFNRCHIGMLPIFMLAVNCGEQIRQVVAADTPIGQACKGFVEQGSVG